MSTSTLSVEPLPRAGVVVGIFLVMALWQSLDVLPQAERARAGRKLPAATIGWSSSLLKLA